MMISIWWLIVPIWITLGGFLAYKQGKCDGEWDTETTFIYIVCAPLTLIFAILRQVFMEDWK